MSTTADVILATGPSVVALAAIGAAVWQQRRGFGHEREMADLAGARSLLDDAALALHRAGAGTDDYSEAGAVERVQANLWGELDPIRQRLIVRFGPRHAVVEAFSDAINALNDWSFTCNALSRSEDDGGPDADTMHDAFIASLEESEIAFKRASARFVGAAVKTAGARLP